MYLNDIEETFLLQRYKGIDLGVLKLCLVLYADDIVLFSETDDGLQEGLNLLQAYCLRWKLKVNTNKTKIMIFKKGGRNRNDLVFTYDGLEVEIVNKFTYLGIVFTTGGSFSETH